jgi:hypothetical protein
MKKFLVGCLGVIGVVAIAGGIAVYVFYIKPATEFVGGVARMGQEYAELEQRIADRGTYQPPEDNRVTEEQFARFLAAQQQIRARMEGRFGELQVKYEAMEGEIEAQQREPRMQEMAEAYRDMGDLLLEAKRAQVDALNDHEFSLQEYAWVRYQVYRAIGESVAVAAGPMAAGEGQPEPPADTGRPHPDTVAMVEPHHEALMQAHALAWWGL